MHQGHIEADCADCASFVPLQGSGELNNWGYCTRLQETLSAEAVRAVESAYRERGRTALAENTAGIFRTESGDACDFFRPRGGA